MALRAKDIAEMLGVSTATVSLVLNNKPGVGEKRRQEIIQKIKEMDCGYMLKEQSINKVQSTTQGGGLSVRHGDRDQPGETRKCEKNNRLKQIKNRR